MKQRVIALGFFDGVHLGHGALLRRTVEEARSRGCTAAVFTFDRLPREVVTGIPCPLINSPADRSGLLQQLSGIDEVLMVPFDRDMMNTEWDAFVTDILVERYGAVHLVAGDDHRDAVADDLNGDGIADVVLTIEKADHKYFGATGAWLVSEDQNLSWLDLSTLGNGFKLLDTGYTAAKKTSDIYVVN